MQKFGSYTMKQQIKDNIGKEVGTCPVCGINTYGTGTLQYGKHVIKGRPLIMPCGVEGPAIGNKKLKANNTERSQCPWESKQDQVSIPSLPDLSK